MEYGSGKMEPSGKAKMRIVPVIGSLQQRIKTFGFTGRCVCNQQRKCSVDCGLLQKCLAVWYGYSRWKFQFQNSQSKRFKALKLVRNRIRRIVELTGTPSSNGLEDLWAQVYLLDGGARLGKTISAYRDKYFIPGKRSRTTIFNYEPKEGSFDMIQKAIGDIRVSVWKPAITFHFRMFYIMTFRLSWCLCPKSLFQIGVRTSSGNRRGDYNGRECRRSDWQTSAVM